mmetsp:Transcript_69927/g.176181  ORF Transcript_69927/g.176181 Transcript_69927/m.176181 type:complete len:335 (+) Transcript_69927:15-1019(+)
MLPRCCARLALPESGSAGDARCGVVGPIDRLAQGRIVAILEHSRVLQRVVSHTRGCPAVARREVWLEDLAVVHETDTERIHAALEEAILAAVGTESLLAPLCVVEVGHHRFLRENLDGAQELPVGEAFVSICVLDVNGRTGWNTQIPEVGAEAVGEEGAICIRLDGPIVLDVTSVGLHLIPDFEEDRGILEGRLARVPPCRARLPRMEYRGGITSEDALAIFFCDPHQGLLRGVGKDGHEAIEGHPSKRRVHGCRLERVLGPPLPKHCTLPTLGDSNWRVDPSGMLNCLHAGLPSVILHHTRKANVGTAMCCGAIFPGPGARRRERSALTQLFA